MLALPIVNIFYIYSHGKRIHVSFVVLISVKVGVIICKTKGASKRK